MRIPVLGLMVYYIEHGEKSAAIITKVHSEESVNLLVFLDGISTPASYLHVDYEEERRNVYWQFAEENRVLELHKA